MVSMQRATPVLCLLGMSLFLAGCQKQTRPPEPRPTAPPPTSTTTAPADLSGATLYEVNPKVSQVNILVYRGGTLARLGHNHVMTSNALSGRVWVNQANFARSGFQLSFPVKELVVDDNEARRAAGADFPLDVPEKDREGTRANMLKPEVLDGEHYPTIKLASTHVGGTLEAPTVTARITIKDATHDVEVPTHVKIEGTHLMASGEFDIRQTDFDMKPFSVGLGALEVKDQLHVKFTIAAEKK